MYGEELKQIFTLEPMQRRTARKDKRTGEIGIIIG